jgi:Glycosyl hydrolases family 2
MKGDWTTIDPENQLHMNKPPFFLGPYWDGIPADGDAAFPMGLWRDVRLLSSAVSVIDDLFVSTKSLNTDGSAILAISGTIRNYGAGDVNSVLKLQITPESFQGESLALSDQTLSLHPGDNEIALETNIKNPKLWWTWDLGGQNWYKLTGSLGVERNAVSDIHAIVFGIRSIALKSDMSYWLNGKRLFLKGTWYPMSDYGSKPTRERFEKDLLLFRAANLNHLVAFTEAPWFSDDGFGRGTLVTTGSATCLHSYAYFTDALKYYRYDAYPTIAFQQAAKSQKALITGHYLRRL